MPLLRRARVPFFLAAIASAGLLSCELRTPPALITVYSPTLELSAPIPQGWTSEIGEQAGYRMQTFTGRSVDVPGRAGIRVQIMTGPVPEERSIDEIGKRYTEGHEVSHEQGYSLHGHAGRTWHFVSPDGEERSRLMLTLVEGTLYGIYAHGEARTMEAFRTELDALWEGFSIERARFFASYERPDFDLALKYPRSWKETGFVVSPRKSLFVSFRSPPLAVEQEGTTIHATLEVTVNDLEEESTLESFYVGRVEMLGDNYRLLRHESIREGKGISDLYHIETQLADYLERTLYFVHGDMSYVFKFNARNQVYREIEAWIQEIAGTFQTVPPAD